MLDGITQTKKPHAPTKSFSFFFRTGEGMRQHCKKEKSILRKKESVFRDK